MHPIPRFRSVSAMKLSALIASGWLAVVLLTDANAAASTAPIDRHALITRHNPGLKALDPWAALSVSNGQFAFTGDVTGLQTLASHYVKNGIPVETHARWAWYSDPNPNGFKLSDANRPLTAYGKTVQYPTNERTPAGM